jgi:hypothetical protein
MQTLEQIIERVNEEKRFGSRFPVRIVFIDDINQYQELVDRLKNTCDETIEIAELCSAEDVYPNFSNLTKRIDKYKEKQILLLSLSEYLRLAIKRETQSTRSQFPTFWQTQQNASSRTRIIVPLFACKELFDRVVPSRDARQLNNIWELATIPSQSRKLKLTIYSSKFRGKIAEENTIDGLQNWLGVWLDKISLGECSLITSRYEYAENTKGLFSVYIIDSPFDYILNIVSNGNMLEKDWGSDDQWASIVNDVVSNMPFDKTIEKALNEGEFESESILPKWNTMSEKQRWLTWMWYQINDSNDYYGYVFRHSIDSSSVVRTMHYSILSAALSHPEWIDQYKYAVQALVIGMFEEDWFDQLDTLSSLETKLSILTNQTHEERTYAIKMVSVWMRKGGEKQEIIDLLQDNFPLLTAYLTNDNQPFELTNYFRWYRENKIKNEFSQTAPNVNLEVYDSRYGKISQYTKGDCFVLWIDGMGVEWLPLLLYCIELQSDSVSVSSEVATSIAPTETRFNDQWTDSEYDYDKIDKLDILAHKGTPDDRDYFSCIDYQLSTISGIAQKAIRLLSNYACVIITADHGSSRMAALSFHDTVGIKPPQGALVKSYGRFCELPSEPLEADLLPYVQYKKNDGKHYLVLLTEEHYSQSGNIAGGNSPENAVAGEVHGGMTPEEYLVPVVTLKKIEPRTPLEYLLEDSDVIRENHRVDVVLIFSRPILKLKIKAGSNVGTCSKVGDRKWKATFVDMEIGKYTITVTADGKLLSKKESFLVKAKGISQNDNLFGDR